MDVDTFENDKTTRMYYFKLPGIFRFG